MASAQPSCEAGGRYSWYCRAYQRLSFESHCNTRLRHTLTRRWQSSAVSGILPTLARARNIFSFPPRVSCASR
eukprot:4872903-Prymnesium_polylepis.1